MKPLLWDGIFLSSPIFTYPLTHSLHLPPPKAKHTYYTRMHMEATLHTYVNVCAPVWQWPFNVWHWCEEQAWCGSILQVGIRQMSKHAYDPWLACITLCDLFTDAKHSSTWLKKCLFCIMTCLNFKLPLLPLFFHFLLQISMSSPFSPPFWYGSVKCWRTQNARKKQGRHTTKESWLFSGL